MSILKQSRNVAVTLSVVVGALSSAQAVPILTFGQVGQVNVVTGTRTGIGNTTSINATNARTGNDSTDPESSTLWKVRTARVMSSDASLQAVTAIMFDEATQALVQRGQVASEQVAHLRNIGAPATHVTFGERWLENQL